MKRTRSTRSSLPSPTQPPSTLSELSLALRLASDSDTEALLRAWPVKEAFHYCVNRCFCLASTSTSTSPPPSLPDWKLIDAYLHDTAQQTATAEALSERVGRECLAQPYEALPHAAMFVLRVGAFLDSREGRRFEPGPGPRKKLVKKKAGREFDRRARVVRLLEFMLRRHREGAGW